MGAHGRALGAVALIVVMLQIGAGTPAEAAPPAPAVDAPAVDARAAIPSPDSGPAVAHDVSAPLRSIIPHGPTGRVEREPRRQLPLPAAVAGTDPVVQTRVGATIEPFAPVVRRGFDGLGEGFTGPAGDFSVEGVPPDPNAAVGPNAIVEIVNVSFAIFDKTGAVQYGPAPTNTLFRGFGGPCEHDNDGDAVVSYDSLASRWVISQLAVEQFPYFECVAVSRTGDPAGAYSRYAFYYKKFPDYPKLGVWRDGYYVTFNLFSRDEGFVGSEVCAYDRAAMVQGLQATQQCFVTTPQYGGLLPADIEGATPPPAGAPNVVIGLGPTTSALAYWKFHVDWTTPANSTFVGPGVLPVAPYVLACQDVALACVPQLVTDTRLDALSDRLMYRLVYRNFGDHESLVVSHAVHAPGALGVRWYELRLAAGNPTVYQQGTFAPDDTYRWMSSASIDASGGIAVGYSVSSSAMHPGLRATGRRAGDPLGQMTQGETVLVAGGGSQQFAPRWGDYSSMAVDPSDGCTFWYTGEYLAEDGVDNWRTRLGAFTLPGCGAGAAGDFSVSVAPGRGSVGPGGSVATTVSTTVTQVPVSTVTLIASGLPAGSTATFTPSSVAAGGSATMRLTTSPGTPPGTYRLVVAAHAGSLVRTTQYTLTVGLGTIDNGGFELGDLDGWSSAGSVAIGGPRAGFYGAVLGTAYVGTSSLAQTFTVDPARPELSLWYRVACTSGVSGDGAIVTVADTTAGGTTTVVARTCTHGQSWQRASARLVARHTYTLTLANRASVGSAATVTYDDVALTSAVLPLVNGDFETGDLDGWDNLAASGGTTVVAGDFHSGGHSALLGTFRGHAGDYSIAQTFTADAATPVVSLWYRVDCVVAGNGAVVTLTDHVTGTTRSVVPKVCELMDAWKRALALLTAGHVYTLTLTVHATGDFPVLAEFDEVAVLPRGGYRMADAEGNVYDFGQILHFGDAVTEHVTDIESTPGGSGYWVVDAAGHVFAFGDAPHLGDASGLLPGELVTSISGTADGAGYWLFTSRGRAVAFGDATFLGDVSGVALNAPVLDSAGTPSGRGYFMVAADGGVFAFGDARFRGSMAGRRLNAPVRALVPDPDGVGYWLAASDGGVFSFAAPFRGSMGGVRLNRPVVAMVGFGDGYLMVAADGGVFDFSDKPFFGSFGDHPPGVPIVSVAAVE